MFAWLTKRIIARLPSRREAVALTRVSSRGLDFQQANGRQTLIPWDAIERVMATVSTQLVGDTQILVFGLASGGSAIATEADPAWTALTEQLHLHLVGATRATMWQLELLAGKPVEVYRR